MTFGDEPSRTGNSVTHQTEFDQHEKEYIEFVGYIHYPANCTLTIAVLVDFFNILALYHGHTRPFMTAP